MHKVSTSEIGPRIPIPSPYKYLCMSWEKHDDYYDIVYPPHFYFFTIADDIINHWKGNHLQIYEQGKISTNDFQMRFKFQGRDRYVYEFYNPEIYEAIKKQIQTQFPKTLN